MQFVVVVSMSVASQSSASDLNGCLVSSNVFYLNLRFEPSGFLQFGMPKNGRDKIFLVSHKS